MGTRGFITFVVDGAEKTAYNHWDSYPDGLGSDVLSWLRDVDIESAQLAAGHLRVVDPDSTPTPEDVERLAPWTDLGVGNQSTADWYCLLRRTQGSPSAMLAAGVIEDARDFPTDSLFAEWGYVVDFDAGAFEVYVGFQRAPHSLGRFADRPTAKDAGGYAPVALAASWPLAELPSDEAFYAALVDEEDDPA